MNLWLITFELDLTQFIVDAESRDKAIEKSIEVNKSEYLGKWDEEILSKDDMESHENYSSEKISMDLLGEIMERNDYVGNCRGVLIFND